MKKKPEEIKKLVDNLDSAFLLMRDKMLEMIEEKEHLGLSWEEYKR